MDALDLNGEVMSDEALRSPKIAAENKVEPWTQEITLGFESCVWSSNFTRSTGAIAVFTIQPCNAWRHQQIK